MSQPRHNGTRFLISPVSSKLRPGGVTDGVSMHVSSAISSDRPWIRILSTENKLQDFGHGCAFMTDSQTETKLDLNVVYSGLIGHASPVVRDAERYRGHFLGPAELMVSP